MDAQSASRFPKIGRGLGQKMLLVFMASSRNTPVAVHTGLSDDHGALWPPAAEQSQASAASAFLLPALLLVPLLW